MKNFNKTILIAPNKRTAKKLLAKNPLKEVFYPLGRDKFSSKYFRCHREGFMLFPEAKEAKFYWEELT